MEVSFFLLMARYGTLVGPNFWKVIQCCPLAELGGSDRVDTVADRYDGIKIVVRDAPVDLT